MPIYDFIEQFLLVLDQLAVCRDLLLSDSPARHRMALILLDNLTDVLIFRHNRKVMQGAHDRYARRLFTTKQRIALQKSFEKRLQLAQEPALFSFTGSEPLIDEGDARVLRVAHFYRNSAYHRDSHSPALIGVLGRILFRTVCRMTVRAYSRGGFGSSGRKFAEQIERLNAYLEPPGIDVTSHAMLNFKERAEQATARLSEQLAVELPAARAAFADDLRSRANAAVELASGLVGEGLDEPSIRAGITSAAFWERYDGDPELIRHLEEARSLRANISDRDDPNWKRLEEAERKYVDRMRSLDRQFKPDVSLDYLDEGEAAASRISAADSLASLLEEYERADRQMTALENYLGDVAAEWDWEMDLRFQEWKESRHARGEGVARPDETDS